MPRGRTLIIIICNYSSPQGRVFNIIHIYIIFSHDGNFRIVIIERVVIFSCIVFVSVNYSATRIEFIHVYLFIYIFIEPGLSRSRDRPTTFVTPASKYNVQFRCQCGASDHPTRLPGKSPAALRLELYRAIFGWFVWLRRKTIAITVRGISSGVLILHAEDSAQSLLVIQFSPRRKAWKLTGLLVQ